MSDKTTQQKLDSDPGPVPPGQAPPPAASAKPLERLQVTVEFDTAMDHAVLGELLDALKLYGRVTAAKRVVLRRHSRELV